MIYDNFYSFLKDALKNIRNQCQQVIWNSEHEFVLKHVGEQCMIYDKIYIESSQKMKKIQKNDKIQNEDVGQLPVQNRQHKQLCLLALLCYPALILN